MSGMDVERGIGWSGGAIVVDGISRGEVEEAISGVRSQTRQADLTDTPYPMAEAYGGVVFDFTNDSGDTFLGSSIVKSDAVFSSDYFYGLDSTRYAEAKFFHGHRVLNAPLSTTRLAYEPGKWLLPSTGDFTLVFSYVTENTNRQGVIWQHATGAAGRVQITGNAGFNGGITEQPGFVNFFFDGASDGAGFGGQPRPVASPVGQPSVFAIVMRSGTGASEIWRNGQLYGTFTRPPSIAATQTSIFGNSGIGGYDSSGQSFGRIAVINHALDEREVAVVGDWCGASLGIEWDGEEASGDLDITLASPYAVTAYVPPVQGGEATNLFEKSINSIWYPASLTKIMTCMILLDNEQNMSRTMEVLAEDATAGSGNNLLTGDIITVSDAIYNMMLPSSNVTTSVVARVIGSQLSGSGTSRDKFIAAMNAKAVSLGMSSTVFLNASGLHANGMQTTALDMSIMGRAALEYSNITSRWGAPQWNMQITGANARTVTITSSVQMIEDNDVLGGKTGTTTTALSNLLLYVSMPGGNRVITVTLGAPTDSQRYSDTRAMIDAVRNSYDWPILAPTRR